MRHLNGRLQLWQISRNRSDAGDLCNSLSDSKIIAQDGKNTYLGLISNGYDKDSIFNQSGVYGSSFSKKSIWNDFSTFGNNFNSYSPFNEFSANPPKIIKNGRIIGYLSINKKIKNAISPYFLRSVASEFV